MKVHLIAIGGAVMHNLAIALKRKGYRVSGSDDEIFDPARSRLEQHTLMPGKEGWDAQRITQDIDVVILGMHAKGDNPELLKARELELPIYSFPEYLYEQAKDKTRVVIGGSHGKTTITAMVLHVLHQWGINTDFMVGAMLEGFDVMVRLTKHADVMVFEGDEYLASTLDKRPKFHLYHPHIALLSGIAWDHINVFPTYENYKDQFRKFVGLIPQNGTLIYFLADDDLKEICENTNPAIQHKIPYDLPVFEISQGTTFLVTEKSKVPLEVFGRHNLSNINGARHVCNSLGINDEQFFEAIQSFKGASNRLELIDKNEQTAVYKDFAHAPSKLKATTQAVKEQYPERELVACMELHTFSSLNKDFLRHYAQTMDAADKALVFFSPHALEVKRLPPLSKDEVAKAFGHRNLRVFENARELQAELEPISWPGKNLLMMSSGNFRGIDLKKLTHKILSQ